MKHLLASCLIACGMSFGCETPPPPGSGPYRSVYPTPEALLNTLQQASQVGMISYYTAFETATDCQEIPELCNLLTAQKASAIAMLRLYGSMSTRFGQEGAQAGQIMMADAFNAEYYAIKSASVHSGNGDFAMLRIGENVYRIRKGLLGWQVVQASTTTSDPVATAKAMDILAQRVEQIHVGIDAGRYRSMSEVAAAMKQAIPLRN